MLIKEQKIKEIKEALRIIEGELLNPEVQYSWPAIEQAFKLELPMLSAEAVGKFQKRLEAAGSCEEPNPKRKGYGRRKLPPGIPTALEMTSPIIEFLAGCKNMMASKTAIFNGIKNQYPKKIRELPHRTRGEDTPMSLLEYRVAWACTILVRNGKAV